MNHLIRFWHFDFAMIVFITLLCILYFYFFRLRKSKKTISFIVSLLLLVLCTCSPLAWLAQHYLFSVHMIVHVTLFLIIPPLLIFSLPDERRSFPIIEKISAKVSEAPWLVWIMGVGIMWFWHIPSIFKESMTGGSLLYHVQNFSLIIIGLAFWLPVSGTISHYRLSPPKAMLYLFAACIGCSLLGLLITFAPAGLYPMEMSATYNFMPVVRSGWGISQGMDQQIAGLIMWVPGCLIYLSGALFLFRDWMQNKTSASREISSNLI